MLLATCLPVAFRAPSPLCSRRCRSAVAMAEGGPPQIDWQDAKVLSNDPLSRGTMQLRVQASAPVDYKAGHILGFELSDPDGAELKGPYTVTRPAGPDAFDIIYRVIPDGRKTPHMEKLAAGAAVRFGGRFGTPVADGIAADVDRVVGIATGAGIGPLVGYAEAALAEPDGPKIELYAGFRDLADVCGGACNELAARHPTRFSWSPVISKPMACAAVGLSGIGSGTPPPPLPGLPDEPPAPSATGAPPPPFLQGRVSTVVPSQLGDVSATTHFHLVGNGQFVVDFRQGLLDGGVAEERVTTEKYFNGKADADADVVAFIADAVRKGLAVPQGAA